MAKALSNAQFKMLVALTHDLDTVAIIGGGLAGNNVHVTNERGYGETFRSVATLTTLFNQGLVQRSSGRSRYHITRNGRNALAMMGYKVR